MNNKSRLDQSVISFKKSNGQSYDYLKVEDQALSRRNHELEPNLTESSVQDCFETCTNTEKCATFVY